MERREACKGAKEVTKRCQPSQISKSSAAAPKSQSSNNIRRNDASLAPANQSTKGSKSASNGGPAYDEKVLKSWYMKLICMLRMRSLIVRSLAMQITELKLSVDSLEKERDFYFAKLRDIEILCQCPEIEESPVLFSLFQIDVTIYLFS